MDELWHGRGHGGHGIPHDGSIPHSGRYEWGSGENPFQRTLDLGSQIFRLNRDGKTKDEICQLLQMSSREYDDTRFTTMYHRGYSEQEIREELGINSSEYRARASIARERAIFERDKRIKELKDRDWSNTAIARELGMSEGSVRNVLNGVAKNKDATRQLADVLKEQLEAKPYLDVGKGVELQLGVNKTRKDTALKMLEQEGYTVQTIDIPQTTNPNQKTTFTVLAKDGVTKAELYANQYQITPPFGVFFEDFGLTKRDVKPPVSIDGDRVAIRYAEEGGTDRDGVLQIRPGVADLSLGHNHYAQVRVAVNGTHYLKGMAVYGTDEAFANVPKDVDIIFNTNKHEGTPKLGPDNDHSVLKVMKDTQENPFGAVTRQWDYTDEKGEKHQSPINIVNDDTDWDKWSKNLSSQFLSKQPEKLAKKQLNIDAERRENEFKEICALTNPTVKKKLLETFADECDSAAVDLKAAAFPDQATHVMLPVPSLKEGEVYAPKYPNGTELALIRYPHGGQFEIVVAKVNNNNPEGKTVIGNARNAIGTRPDQMEKLSGADYDGDTAVVFPCKGLGLMSRATLEGLRGFDPKEQYKAYPGMPRVGKQDTFRKQIQMGSVSNLITDMTMRGANWDEIARAVRHSMVIIDAEKHNLDWKRSEQENGIKELKALYQGRSNAGASTLISRSSAEIDLPERKEVTAEFRMTPEQKARYEEGYKVYENTGRHRFETYADGIPIKEYVKLHDLKNANYVPKELKTYVDTGKIAKGTTSTKMAEVDDAFEISSTGNRDTAMPIEVIYGDYANRMKALAREARKELMATPNLKYSKEARETYSDERASLIAQMQLCVANAPFERQANALANANFRSAKEAHPDWDKDAEKKYRAIYLKLAREAVHSGKEVSRKTLSVKISPREWDAIQAGAISENTLNEILRFADIEQVRKYATPRLVKGPTNAQMARIRTLHANGKSIGDIADALDLSTKTVSMVINGAA